MVSYTASAEKQVIQYRFRFAAAESYGKFNHIKLRVRNISSISLSVGVYICTKAGDSSTGRVQSGIDQNLTADGDWITLDGLTKVDGDIYGFSLYVRNENIAAGETVNASILVDDVILYNA